MSKRYIIVTGTGLIWTGRKWSGPPCRGKSFETAKEARTTAESLMQALGDGEELFVRPINNAGPMGKSADQDSLRRWVDDE